MINVGVSLLQEENLFLPLVEYKNGYKIVMGQAEKLIAHIGRDISITRASHAGFLVEPVRTVNRKGYFLVFLVGELNLMKRTEVLYRFALLGQSL